MIPKYDIHLWFGPDSAKFARVYRDARRNGRIAMCVGTPDNQRCLPFEAAGAICLAGADTYTSEVDDDHRSPEMDAFVDRFIHELQQELRHISG